MCCCGLERQSTVPLTNPQTLWEYLHIHKLHFLSSAHPLLLLCFLHPGFKMGCTTGHFTCQPQTTAAPTLEGQTQEGGPKVPEVLSSLERLSQATGGMEKSWYRCIFPFGIISLVIGVAGTGVTYTYNDLPQTKVVSVFLLIAGLILVLMATACWTAHKKKRRKKKEGGSFSSEQCPLWEHLKKWRKIDSSFYFHQDLRPLRWPKTGPLRESHGKYGAGRHEGSPESCTQFTVAQQVSGIKTSLERTHIPACTHTGHLTLTASHCCHQRCCQSSCIPVTSEEAGQRRQPDTATKEEFTSVTIARHSPVQWHRSNVWAFLRSGTWTCVCWLEPAAADQDRKRARIGEVENVSVWVCVCGICVQDGLERQDTCSASFAVNPLSIVAANDLGQGCRTWY